MIRNTVSRLHSAALLFVMVIAAARTEAAGLSDAEAIRGLRLQYNQVIQQRRPEGFAAFLSPTFTELISTGEVTHGAKAVADSYAADEFKNPNFIAYDRHPDTVVVAKNGLTAVERGHWRARFRAVRPERRRAIPASTRPAGAASTAPGASRPSPTSN